MVNLADDLRVWSSEEDLHQTWDSVKRYFPEDFERIIQRELDAMERDNPDLRSDWQHILLLHEEHPS